MAAAGVVTSRPASGGGWVRRARRAGERGCATAEPALVSRQTGVGAEPGAETQAQCSRMLTGTFGFRAWSSRRVRSRGKGRPSPRKRGARSPELGSSQSATSYAARAWTWRRRSPGTGAALEGELVTARDFLPKGATPGLFNRRLLPDHGNENCDPALPWGNSTEIAWGARIFEGRNGLLVGGHLRLWVAPCN